MPGFRNWFFWGFGKAMPMALAFGNTGFDNVEIALNPQIKALRKELLI